MAAPWAQLRGGPTEEPHGVLEKGAGVGCTCAESTPALWGDSPVLATDGGLEKVGSKRDVNTNATVLSGAPLLGPPAPPDGASDIDPKKKQK